MRKLTNFVVLRYGFGIFFLLWGSERALRTSTWANEQMLGGFYGNLGTLHWLVFAIAIMSIIVALSFFFNFKIKITSYIALGMIFASAVVCAKPLVTYLMMGGNPIPSMLFVDHFPLFAGVWVINRSS